MIKRCWDHNPENRPTAEEIYDCLWEYDYSQIKEKKKIIELAEEKRQKIIGSSKFLSDTESFYTSRLLNKSIQQVESLLSLSPTETKSAYRINDDDST